MVTHTPTTSARSRVPGDIWHGRSGSRSAFPKGRSADVARAGSRDRSRRTNSDDLGPRVRRWSGVIADAAEDGLRARENSRRR